MHELSKTIAKNIKHFTGQTWQFYPYILDGKIMTFTPDFEKLLNNACFFCLITDFIA